MSSILNDLRSQSRRLECSRCLVPLPRSPFGVGSPVPALCGPCCSLFLLRLARPGSASSHKLARAVRAFVLLPDRKE